jgi:hypothetical protein
MCVRVSNTARKISKSCHFRSQMKVLHTNTEIEVKACPHRKRVNI